MKIAIMQPYLFPYVGYFNLVSSVDKFIFYDDVNFIKNGWINRNRLYLSGGTRYFTIPLSSASSFAKISEVRTQPKRTWERKLLESIKQSYSKAPNFHKTFDLIRDVFNVESDKVGDFAKNSVLRSSERLRLLVEFIQSSSAYGNAGLHGAERVIDICAKENADEYINLPGGKDLYSVDEFSAKKIRLSFSKPGVVEYSQFKRPFVANLSILDMMMFNSFADCRSLILGSNKIER